jgi:hypothetical protein
MDLGDRATSFRFLAATEPPISPPRSTACWPAPGIDTGEDSAAVSARELLCRAIRADGQNRPH